VAYNNSIPQPTDRIADSQAPILANFAAIDTVVSINHVTFDDPSGDQGKHKWVSLPVQGATPPAGAFAAGEVGMYSFLNPTTSKNELYINKTNQATITQIPATASFLSLTSSPANDSDGWTYLPSGLLVKWGNSNVNGNGTVNYIVGPGAFTKIFNVSVTTIIDKTTTATLLSTSMTQLTVNGSVRNDPTTAKLTYFYYFAIGI
jgi:hypothetical protein